MVAIFAIGVGLTNVYMVDLDSDPTKLLEIVAIGKQTADDPWRAEHVLDRQ